VHYRCEECAVVHNFITWIKRSVTGYRMRYAVVLSEIYCSTDIDMHDIYSIAFCCFIGKENSLQKMNKLYKEFREKGIGIQYGQCNSRVQCRLFTK
jgi:hypothetical protein